MRFVPVNTVDEQARLAWHRVREGYKTEVLATSTRIRAVLAEVGVVMARNDQASLRVLGATAMRAGPPPTLPELPDPHAAHRSELRRLGKVWASRLISRSLRYTSKTTQINFP